MEVTGIHMLQLPKQDDSWENQIVSMRNVKTCYVRRDSSVCEGGSVGRFNHKEVKGHKLKTLFCHSKMKACIQLYCLICFKTEKKKKRRFCSFCIGTLLTEIALEAVKKTMVSFVAPVGMNGLEVTWLPGFQAESWKNIVLSDEIWGAFLGGLCFALWAATCWSNIICLSLWRPWFRFSGCFRWGSPHLKVECLVWAGPVGHM